MGTFVDLKSIKIKGARYIIRWLEQIVDDNGVELYGVCDGPGRQIGLSEKLLKRDGLTGRHKRLLDDFIKKTLLHEMLHGVDEECGLNSNPETGDLLETVIEAHSSFIIDTFELKLK